MTTRRRWPARDRMKVLHAHKEICYLCKQPISRDAGWDLDHIIPLAAGGADSLDNLAPAHRKGCHRAKTKDDHATIGKARRQEQKSWGVKSKKGQGFPKRRLLERIPEVSKPPLKRRPLYEKVS